MNGSRCSNLGWDFCRKTKFCPGKHSRPVAPVLDYFFYNVFVPGGVDCKPQALYNSYMDFKGAIFDLDGTLLDSMEMWLNAGELFLESLGKKAEEGLGAALLQMNVEEGALYIQKKYGLELTCKEIAEGTAAVVKKTYAEKIQPKEGAVDFLKLLSEKKIPCAILTGSDRKMFDGCLKRHGLEKFFQKILTCSELKMSKANPEIYSVAAKMLGSSAQQTLVFEDAPEAIKSASKAGFFTVGIFDQCTHSNSDICSARKNSRLFCRDFFEAADFLRKQGLL